MEYLIRTFWFRKWPIDGVEYRIDIIDDQKMKAMFSLCILELCVSNKQYNFYNNWMWKMSCPSSIRRRDLNPRPLERESTPITTRPIVSNHAKGKVKPTSPSKVKQIMNYNFYIESYPASFSFICIHFKQIYTIKIVEFNGIQTRIVEVEDEHADQHHYGPDIL